MLRHPSIVETTEGLREWNEYCGSASLRIGTEHAANPEHDRPDDELAGSDARGFEFSQAMGIYRQRMVPREQWREDVRDFAARWDTFKVESGRVDFTDLIETALSSLDRLEGALVLFADEAQDMSRLEFSLVRKWGSKCEEFVIVGDPDQNLYEWRGSDPQAFYAGEAASERVLFQSYRVPQAVHQSAVEWVRQIPNRKDAEYRPTVEHGRVERYGFTWKDPAGLVEHMLSTLDAPRARVDGESAMVLAACGYMLNPLVSALRRDGIPFHNPYRRSHGGWNPLVSSRRLLAFQRPSREVWGDDARMWTWSDLRAWGGVLQAKGVFSRGFKGVIESRCAEDRFRDSQSNVVVPLQTLMDNLEGDAVRDAVFNMDIDWWEEHLLHNHRKSQHFALTVARRHGSDRLRERPRIIVGTIHSVKGGEADHVYLFPDLSAAGYYGAWKTNGQARWAVVRQFYVGMTRAKVSLVLCDESQQTSVKWLPESI